MQLTVFFNPAELSFVEVPANAVYIVIDVMRATTTLAVMLEAGASRVLAAHTLEQAQEGVQFAPDRLLCGERHTQIPPGFHYGNSPAFFAEQNLQGRELVLTTSNGTRALFACPLQSTRLAGSFYNGRAVTAYALELAQQRQCDIFIVCAAEYGYFALEDSACAGYLAQELLQQQPELEISDNVRAALTLYECYPVEKLLSEAQSSLDLLSTGQQADLEYCLRKSASSVVPIVVEREEKTGLLVLERATIQTISEAQGENML